MTSGTSNLTEPITSRYDIVYYFDVTDGNPNGDPDAGNLPRIDPETGHGLVTDVCLKRKIRNYVGIAKEDQPPYEIYVKEKAVLNNQHERAFKALEVKSSDKKHGKERDLTAWMCKNFFDIRAFGAVMTTKVNCGQVRGPVQFTFGRSVDPIITSEHSVTRCAVTTVQEAEKQSGDNRTMGRKFTIPYGLYRTHIYISPHFSNPDRNGTGFSEGDMALFREAMTNMFEHDHSAARGSMTGFACCVFKHENGLGNARSQDLFARINAKAIDEVATGERPARSGDDFKLFENVTDLPEGVSYERWF
jgi:CRISPR-associated protein Csd2